MAHSLNPSPVVSTSFFSAKTKNNDTPFRILGYQSQRINSQHDSDQAATQTTSLTTSLDTRRKSMWCLTGAVVLGTNAVGEQARAAQKRGPPPPPVEKKDPNLSGVQAKALASKKRKEAMKETAAKLREQGKPVN